MKKILAAIAVMIVALTGFAWSAANADTTTQCVPKAAWTETVEHPAVTHVEHYPAVDAVPGQWWNWSPNHNQAPFDGPPAFPNDERGTWEGPHTEGGPGQDQIGTFQQGNGHGSWFHRELGIEGQDAYDVTVTDQEAWTETIEHAAVTCDPGTPTGDPTLGPPPVKHVRHHDTVTTVTLPHTGA